MSDATEEHIARLIAPGSLDSGTAAVLVNALYFRGQWATPFAPEATRPAPFKLDSGSSIEVPTMHADLTVPFAETDLVEIAELPYQDGRLAMAVVLPRQGRSLDEAFVALTSGAVSRALGEARDGKLAVALPKFRVESPILHLKRALQALGVTTAFSARSDFGSLLEQGPPLELADVLHRVLLEVDERGATAAAATAAVVRIRSRPAPARPFTVDRPFLIVLRDRKSGTPLFVGRIENPKG